VHKSAVIRNRIRRRLYELCRTHLHESAHQDLLFIAHDAGLATMPATKLRRVFLKLCKDAKLPLRADPKRGIVDKKELPDVS
jgi:ribonuclease P protein component